MAPEGVALSRAWPVIARTSGTSGQDARHTYVGLRMHQVGLGWTALVGCVRLPSTLAWSATG